MKSILRITQSFSFLFLFIGNIQAYWVPTNGPSAGSIYSIGVCDSDIFVGTLSGGLFRTTDSGDTWTAVNNGLKLNVRVYSIDVFGTILYAGTDSGMYRSPDRGDSWTQVNNGLTNSSAFFSLANIGTFLYTGSDTGIFRSSDTGNSWAEANAGLKNSRVNDFVVNGSILFAGSDSGVFRSADSGDTWTQVNNGLTNPAVNALALTGSALFSGTTGGGIFRSADSGNSWTQINTGLAITYVWDLVVSGTDLFAATARFNAGITGGVFRSADNGNTWTQVGLQGEYTTKLALLGANIFAVNGLYSGQVWRRPLSEMIPVAIQSSRKISIKYRRPTDFRRFDATGKRIAGFNRVKRVVLIK